MAHVESNGHMTDDVGEVLSRPYLGISRLSRKKSHGTALDRLRVRTNIVLFYLIYLVVSYCSVFSIATISGELKIVI